MYDIISEFFRAFSFRNALSFRISPGMSQEKFNEKHIREISFGCNCRRIFLPSIKVQEPFLLPLIDSPEKSNVLRLYTEADANDSPLFKFLFFWHTLVYPSEDDSAAIAYINDKISIFSPEDTRLQFMQKSRVFNSVNSKDFGNHFLQIRHAIAHIIRKGMHTSLLIDDIEQYRHIDSAVWILQRIAHHRLSTDYEFDKNADASVLSFYPSDNPGTNVGHTS